MAIDTGVVVFSGTATAALVRLATSEAFKGCTARGVADGATALRLELYSDLLLALRTEESAGGEGRVAVWSPLRFIFEATPESREANIVGRMKSIVLFAS